MKNIVVGIHGFGVARSKEFIPLKLKCIENNIDFITFDLYDLSHDDANYLKWLSKVECVMRKYIDLDYNITLVGFSMGGVIASYICSFLPINKLILIAPAFYYTNIESSLNMIYKINEMNKKDKINYICSKRPPLIYTVNFIKLISNLRMSIKLVRCPLLLIYGEKDELVPSKSITYVKNNYQGQIIIKSFEKAHHELHVKGQYVEEVLNVITNELDSKVK